MHITKDRYIYLFFCQVLGEISYYFKADKLSCIENNTNTLALFILQTFFVLILSLSFLSRTFRPIYAFALFNIFQSPNDFYFNLQFYKISSNSPIYNLKKFVFRNYLNFQFTCLFKFRRPNFIACQEVIGLT